MAKLSSAGGHVWSAHYSGTAGPEVVRSLAVTPDGSIVAAGDFDGTIDFGGGNLDSGGGQDAFLTKLAGDGSHLWSREMAGDFSYGSATDVDLDGSVALAGWFDGSIDLGGGTVNDPGSGSALVAKYAP